MKPLTRQIKRATRQSRPFFWSSFERRLLAAGHVNPISSLKQGVLGLSIGN